MIDRIKEAAHGRWTDIITSLTGFDAGFFDGRHHGCPICNQGKDKFRAFNDFNETGGCVCNNCGKMPDGIEFLVTAMALEKKDVISTLAAHLNIKDEKKKAADPEANLEFRDWNDMLVRSWCLGRPPINLDAVKAIGGRIACYRNQHTVIAIPIYNKSFKVCGWIMYAIGNGKLPKYTKGKKVEFVKVKITAGSKPGLVADLERLKTAVEIWKLEGVTDLLAFLSLCSDPEICPITNSNGAGELPAGWIVKMFEGKTARVLHDADQPGEDGAKPWMFALADNCDSVTQVRLPYQIEKSHGKDLRYWLNEGNTILKLRALAENTKAYEPSRTKEGTKIQTENEFPMATKRLQMLGITVLYETDRDEIKCYSRNQRKVFVIKDIGRLSTEKLIQYCGGQAKAHVVKDPSTEDEMTIQQVKEAIATIAASVRSDKVTECGQGIWVGKDPLTGDSTDSIVIVGGGEAARYRNGEIEQLFEPRLEGIVLDMSNQNGWYEFEDLSTNIANAADVGWRRGVFKEIHDVYSQWHFTRQDDAELLVGLIFAAWIQSAWRMRPLVSLSGETDAGKTTLYESLEKIFGNLSWKRDDVTEAAIRQGVNNTSKIVMIDEFEDSKARSRVLKLLRTCLRGSVISRGSASGDKAKEYGMKHIAWIAAQETGLVDQADQNRFIAFELFVPPEKNYKIFDIPPDSDLHGIGQRMLACSIVCCHEAVLLAGKLADEVAAKGAKRRQIECLAVPTAILSVVTGQQLNAEECLRKFLSYLGENDTPESEDEIILDEIISCVVDLGSGRKRTVGQCLEFYSESSDPETRARLESIGVKILEDGIFINPRSIGKYIQRSGRFDQILARLPGAEKTQRRIGGRSCRGIIISGKTLESKAVKSKDVDF